MLEFNQIDLNHDLSNMKLWCNELHLNETTLLGSNETYNFIICCVFVHVAALGIIVKSLCTFVHILF